MKRSASWPTTTAEPAGTAERHLRRSTMDGVTPAANAAMTPKCARAASFSIQAPIINAGKTRPTEYWTKNARISVTTSGPARAPAQAQKRATNSKRPPKLSLRSADHDQAIGSWSSAMPRKSLAPVFRVPRDQPSPSSGAHNSFFAQHSLATARTCGSLSILLGVVVLMGWLLDVPLLRTLLPGHASMRPSAALGAILGGISILFLRSNRRGSLLASLALILMGGGTLIEYLFEIDLGIARLPFQTSPLPYADFQMAPIAAAGFLLAGFSLLLLLIHHKTKITEWISQLLAIALFSLAAIALLGYAFDVQSLYRIAGKTQIAIHAATGLLILSVGILFSSPRTGFMKVALADTLGGYSFRRLLPFVLLAAPTAEFLGKTGREAGLYGESLGTALHVIVSSGVLALLTWIISRRLHLTDLQRRANERDLDRSINRLRILQRATEATSGASKLDDLLSTLLKIIQETYVADTVAVLLVDPEQKNLLLRAAIGLEEEVGKGLRIPFGVGVAGRVLSTGNPVLIPDLTNFETASPVLKNKGIRTLLAAPIRNRGQTIGVIHMGTLKVREFSEDDLTLLDLIAGRIGISIERAQLYEAEVQARREAERALNLRNEFISIASHELKTPLTSMKLQCQILGRQLASHEPSERLREGVLRLLDVGDRQFSRLTRLIEDMLDISRISAGRLQLSREKTDLGDLVKGLIDHLSETARAVGCELRPEIEDGVIGDWDRFRLEQVVINLVTNAIKYGRERPIRVQVNRTVDEAAEIRVIDQGVGIAKQDQERIFERFERTESSAGTSGIGLGLYIAREIVKLHSGKISVESDPGKGSTFIVHLPLRAPKIRPKAA